ncbi:hypothetical protein TNCV_83351 [Trichonephila clavipes]|nr:hypothetical protein TNCV_83351 [Trichonephila clavipes]
MGKLAWKRMDLIKRDGTVKIRRSLWHGHREEKKNGEKEEGSQQEKSQQDGGAREHVRMSGIVITLVRIETKWR